ncbi:non-specific lipid-transfer protein-like protein At2g13820 [Cynara cardunculus var. scolymus]|uniref:Bifunctional inhibitor/plant lipid transfer protein/seed storage helical domain-containing protein n=1 Tax=Cynara cardunculus var. scolymus TaxID=59895 RepID=A0A124SEL1_CYNCS|nr:non-specific lipid-transfer protein-like protein At2g13820 [Cynara cardunculus var. scolymus]KVI00378.1 Bifunctional inhibitor/plant lipid transfer protein/seed storage helical domain-containing protein [Cynara cardunculus var. scolymus]
MAQHQTMLILAITMTVLYGTAMAQSSGCTSVLISMSPCLNYISGNSSTPSSRCCTQLASVVRSQPECLCQVLNGGGSSMGININQTQALELPKACNVQTPPTSRCNASSPTNSPSGTTPSGTGTQSNTVPSTDNGSSDATSTRFASIPIVFSLLVVAYSMVF